MFELALKKGIQYICFSHFEAAGLVVHGFTTRAGGVSRGPYDSLNTAFHVGDSDQNVRRNRFLACRGLGIDSRHLVAGNQVHGDGVRVVGWRDRGRGALDESESIPDTDALITKTSGVPLSSYYADCVPIFLLDPVRKAVALVHAGWKGTVAKIGLKTVGEMTAVFATNPRDCLAGLAPAVGPCCYEVDQRVIGPAGQSLGCLGDLARPVAPGRWQLDLWEANRRVLLEAGLLPGSIVAARVCTSCNNRLFFSYRAQAAVTGRMASLIMLKEQG